MLGGSHRRHGRVHEPRVELGGDFRQGMTLW
jgi:hypothetical protein